MFDLIWFFFFFTNCPFYISQQVLKRFESRKLDVTPWLRCQFRNWGFRSVTRKRERDVKTVKNGTATKTSPSKTPPTFSDLWVWCNNWTTKWCDRGWPTPSHATFVNNLSNCKFFEHREIGEWYTKVRVRQSFFSKKMFFIKNLILNNLIKQFN